MKKYIFLFFTVLISIIMVACNKDENIETFESNLSATKTDENFYVNMNGSCFTKDEYIKFINAFGVDTTATMMEATISKHRDVDIFSTNNSSDTEDFYSNIFGVSFTKEQLIKILDVIDPDMVSVLTEEMVSELVACEELKAESKITETNSYKQITTTISLGNKKLSVITYDYCVIPKEKKEFEISGALSGKLISSSGYQRWDKNTIEYKNGGKKTEISDSNITLKVNTKNEVKHYLKCSLIYLEEF